MEIIWSNYLWEEPKEAQQDEIDNIQAQWNVEFPQDYLDVVRLHQGQSPTPSMFMLNGVDDALSCLLHFKTTGYHASYHIGTIHATAAEFLPPHIFPFAESTGGNYIAFDYSGTSNNPKIVYIDHENMVGGKFQAIHLADSFSELLSHFYDPAL